MSGAAGEGGSDYRRDTFRKINGQVRDYRLKGDGIKQRYRSALNR